MEKRIIKSSAGVVQVVHGWSSNPQSDTSKAGSLPVYLTTEKVWSLAGNRAAQNNLKDE